MTDNNKSDSKNEKKQDQKKDEKPVLRPIVLREGKVPTKRELEVIEED